MEAIFVKGREGIVMPTMICGSKEREKETGVKLLEKSMLSQGEKR